MCVEIKFVGPTLYGTVNNDAGSIRVYKVDILDEGHIIGSIVLEEDSKLYTELYLADEITLKRDKGGEDK